jgi:soluble lytic murein transglycosylase
MIGILWKKMKTTIGKIKIMQWFKALCWCFLILQSTTLLADDLASARKNFLYAEAAIKKGNLQEYYRLKPGLVDYPLYPYLQFAEINRMMANSLPTKHVQAFLSTYPNSSLAIRLRDNWLQALGKQQQWALYRQFYTPSTDTKLQCYAVYAEYKTTQKTAILDKATPLWVVGRSQPDECNALFNAWQKSSYYSSEKAWQRAQLAMQARQSDLATYLKRYVTPAQQKMIDTWLSVHKNPNLVTSSALFANNKNTFMQAIQVDGMKRLISADATKAQATWDQIKDVYPFTAAQRGEVSYAFAIQFSVSHDDNAMKWLNAVPSAQADDPIHEWRVRYAIRHQDWNNVLTQINRMPSQLQQQPLWRYWQGRALLATNQKEQAQTILATLSKERNYHGMLASDLINAPYSLNEAPYKVSSATQKTVASDPGIIRAQELFRLHRLGDARREWNTSTANFNEEQLQAAAKLAYTLNWYDRGILTATQATNRNDLDVRFPLAYANDMKQSAQKNSISTPWAFAIARQESAFLTDAQSPANAVGLMQLLPTTAQEVARKTGQTYKPGILVNPKNNIALGTAYLKQLSTQFHHNTLLATAAYNAGASRVYRWLPDEKMPTDVWVETIPFKETRNYVQNVFSYKVIYQHQLSQKMERLNQHLSYVNP